MLKITFQSGSLPEPAVLTLEGRIAGRWVDELRRVYDEHHGVAHALTIDLREVTFIDQAGVGFFDDVYGQVTLVNCSLFAAEQLKPVLERHDAVRR
jgi:anti-anti-sigma regulatory factor